MCGLSFGKDRREGRKGEKTYPSCFLCSAERIWKMFVATATSKFLLSWTSTRRKFGPMAYPFHPFCRQGARVLTYPHPPSWSTACLSFQLGVGQNEQSQSKHSHFLFARKERRRQARPEKTVSDGGRERTKLRLTKGGRMRRMASVCFAARICLSLPHSVRARGRGAKQSRATRYFKTAPRRHAKLADENERTDARGVDDKETGGDRSKRARRENE